MLSTLLRVKGLTIGIDSPGAFTPGCSARHLPPYIEKLPLLKSKGVDIVACIAFNDAWVMSAWGKANGVKDEIVCAFFRPFHLTAFALWELPSRNKPAERGSIQHEANFEY